MFTQNLQHYTHVTGASEADGAMPGVAEASKATCNNTLCTLHRDHGNDQSHVCIVGGTGSHTDRETRIAKQLQDQQGTLNTPGWYQ